jgi:hypothetical protein
MYSHQTINKKTHSHPTISKAKPTDLFQLQVCFIISLHHKKGPDPACFQSEFRENGRRLTEKDGINSKAMKFQPHKKV